MGLFHNRMIIVAGGRPLGLADIRARETLKFTKGAQKAVELGNFYHFKGGACTHEKAPREPFGPAGLVKSDRPLARAGPENWAD